MSLRLWFSTLSDVGLVRTKNDDSAYAGPRLLAVADGMGGPPGGDIASALTIDALRELDITSPADQPEREAERLTEATLLAAWRCSCTSLWYEVFDRRQSGSLGTEQPKYKGMKMLFLLFW